jgi:hypothetical protein
MYYYEMVLHVVARWIATGFCVVAALILVLSLYDLSIGKGRWGYPWFTPFVVAGFIAIGLAVRKFLILQWEYNKRQEGG